MDSRFAHLRSIASAAALSLVTIVGAPTSVSAAASVTCAYDGSSHTVTVSLVGDVGTRIVRTARGHIKVGGTWCAGRATVTNTDTIVVTGDGGAQTLGLDLRNGGFRPGWTNETGKSDEIEFSVALGAGVDQIVVFGTDAPNAIHFGRMVTQWGTFRLINLNEFADPTDNEDVDVVMSGVDQAAVFGNGGADWLWGWEAWYMDGFDLPLTIFGGPGDDSLVGASANDTIYAGTGTDEVWGKAGDDYIDLRDSAGADLGYGDDGNDQCLGDPGDGLYCETNTN